jgi:hypothetical protein
METTVARGQWSHRLLYSVRIFVKIIIIEAIIRGPPDTPIESNELDQFNQMAYYISSKNEKSY